MASTKYPVSVRFTVKSTIKELLADKTPVCIFWSSANIGGADDNYEFTGEYSKNWETTTVSQFVNKWLKLVRLSPRWCNETHFKTLFGWNWDEIPSKEEKIAKEESLPENWKELYWNTAPDLQPFSELVCDYCEAGEGLGWLAILTRKDAERFKSNQWAIKMNERAQIFCAKHKVDFASIPFFNALSREIRWAKNARSDYFGGEQSAERYAAHQACGSGSYWEDNDYMSSRLSQPIHDLQELLRFCQLKLPCQYALWRESRLKK
jgi:hypothetical protein